MPARVVLGVRDAGVEAGLGELPAAASADTFGQHSYVVVRVRVTERLASRVEEILPVDEDYRALDRRIRRHGLEHKK